MGTGGVHLLEKQSKEELHIASHMLHTSSIAAIATKSKQMYSMAGDWQNQALEPQVQVKAEGAANSFVPWNWNNVQKTWSDMQQIRQVPMDAPAAELLVRSIARSLYLQHTPPQQLMSAADPSDCV